MEDTAVAPQFSAWSAPGHSLKIEYAAPVMDQMRIATVEGFHRVPHGGVETGGILFGTHEADLVRILAWRPIVCEYARGPSFVLSDNDEMALAQALQSWREDPDLAALEPVGWYHSHTRSEIFLSEADVQVYDRFFPQPWQIAVVLRPASFAPTRAGFFFREPGGGLRSESSYREIPLPVAKAARAIAEEPHPAASDPEPVKADRPRFQPPPRRPAFTPSARPKSFPAQWKWIAIGLFAVLAAIVAWRLFQPSHPRLALSLTDSAGQLRIVWDGAAAPIARASRGWIEIDDHGVRTEVKLTPAELRSGSISYARQSGDVMVKLTVQPSSGTPAEETSRFLKPGEPNAAASPAQNKPELDRESQEIAARIEQQKQELSKLQEIAGTQSPAPTTTGPLQPPKPVFQPPKPIPAQPATVAITAPPPRIDTASTSSAAPPLALPAASTVAPPAAPRPAPAAAGRVIWTGKLPKSGSLTIEGNHASAGALVGSLPAIAMHASAYPGDLTGDGVTLYTSDAKYTQPKTEAASEQNGWNQTTYVFDPKRAASVRILEPPSAQNGYRIVLQGEPAKLPMVVIQWRAAQ